MNNYGVGDRNYLDPALFRSIMVEKSPALTRGVKSGVGGAVSIRTIEAEDIVPEGDKWGVPLGSMYSNCTELMDAFGITGKSKEEVMQIFPNDGGQFSVLSGAQQNTRVTRTGFDISNRFRLGERLNLTADYQNEKLEEEVDIVNSQDLFNLAGMATGMSKLAGPRGGKRREWGANLVFDWRPTNRLKLSAGVRYHNFRGHDTALVEGRRNHDPRYMAGGNADVGYYRAGVYLPYWELVGDQEAQEWNALASQIKNAYASGDVAADQAEQVHGAKYNLPRLSTSGFHGSFSGNYIVGNSYKRIDKKGSIERRSNASGQLELLPENTPLYRIRPVFIPYVNSKLDSSVIDSHYHTGMFEEKIDNPQGLNGHYNRYWASRNSNDFYKNDCQKAGCTDISYLFKLSDMRGGYADYSDDPGIQPAVISAHYTEEQRWAEPMRAHAWAPTIAVSYDVTDNSRLFARYAQMTRFPSVYEVGSFYNDLSYISMPFAPNFRFKPERSRSWEIAYSWNFAPYWRALRHGDMRLTYYRNRIENVIETTDHFRTTQYDRKNTAGLEWQSRIDTGRFFASLGATYRLKQEICDRDTTADFDAYRDRGLPECIEGGYGSTRGYQALQPKYSVNLDLGTRLLGEKLELGLRGIYHSSVDTKQYDRLMQQGWSAVFNTTGKPYHWRPSMIWDVYGRYQAHKNLDLNFGITNLSNRYYLDPMSNVPAPGPGRTVTFGITAKF